MTPPLWIVAWSENYRAIFEQHFMRSFDALFLSDKVELRPRFVDWNANYGDTNFNDGYRASIHAMLEVFEANPGRLIISSGADFHFYRADLVDAVADALAQPTELVCTQDRGEELCTCFFAAYSTPAICYFLREWALPYRHSWLNVQLQDGQPRFNLIARQIGLRFKMLPQTFWTHGIEGLRGTDDPVWDGKDPMAIPDPPEGIYLHHANFTVGIDNKLALLNEVETRMNLYLSK